MSNLILDPIITLCSNENDEENRKGNRISVYSLQTDTLTIKEGHLLEGVYILDIYISDKIYEAKYRLPNVYLNESSKDGISVLDFTKIPTDVKQVLEILTRYQEYESVDTLHNNFGTKNRETFGVPTKIKNRSSYEVLILTIFVFISVIVWWNTSSTTYDAKYVAKVHLSERNTGTNVILSSNINDYKLFQTGELIALTKNNYLNDGIFEKKEDIVEYKEKIKLFLATRLGKVEKLKLEIESQELSLKSKNTQLGGLESEEKKLLLLNKSKAVSNQAYENIKKRVESVKYSILSMKKSLDAKQIELKSLKKGHLLSSNDFSDGMKIPLGKSLQEIFSESALLNEFKKSLSQMEAEKILLSWCDDCYFVRDYFISRNNNFRQLLDNNQYVIFAAKSDKAVDFLQTEVMVDNKAGKIIQMLPKDQIQFVGFNPDEFIGFKLSFYLVELYDQTYTYDDDKKKLGLFSEPTEVVVKGKSLF
ncbi:MAG: hypothetical protein GY828_04650 [Candidatus Gracilibacteria bacterium]|nr:hypothetical protein [Candidatus Gracilibacteria bacterium]